MSQSRLVGFGAQNIEPDHLVPWEEQERRNREMLSHALNLRDTILFMGAGCSVALGYPNWKEFAEKAVDYTFELDKDLDEGSATYLKEIKSLVHAEERSGNYLMFVLGACERMWRQYRGEEGIKAYRTHLAEIFKKREIGSKVWNPYHHALDLQIRRFVTSNYDCALEETISRRWPSLKEDYSFKPQNSARPKSSTQKCFTQAKIYEEQLSIFAIARATEERRVFHCHGWCHEPEDMIITEADYQFWYLREHAVGGGRFRQTIDLIFGSNPILFVGFSLRDEDLLLALRVLSAAEPKHKHSRPVFALLERNSKAKEKHSDEKRFEQLFDRYGVHVISYPKPETYQDQQPPESKPNGYYTALCKMLEALADDYARHNADGHHGTKKNELCALLKKIAKKCLRDSRSKNKVANLVKHIKDGLRPYQTKNEKEHPGEDALCAMLNNALSYHKGARSTREEHIYKALTTSYHRWQWAATLCEALDKIGNDCRKHREEWLNKPAFRTVKVTETAPAPYFHYKYPIHLAGDDRLLKELIDEVNKTKERENDKDPDQDVNAEEGGLGPYKNTSPRIIALIGPGGTGKSWLAMQLLEELAKREKQTKRYIHGFFFWSSYYTDDALNGINRALEYLKAPKEPNKTRVERLRACLRKKKYLLVFDGIERFLHETNTPGHVRSANSLVRRLLEACGDKASQSTVILTSRLLPAELEEIRTAHEEENHKIYLGEIKKNPCCDQGSRCQCIKVIPAEGFSIKQATDLLAEANKKNPINQNQVSSLVSWLGGHRYGVTLAANWLANSSSAKPFSNLLHKMSETDPENRVSKMIGLSIEDMLEKDEIELLKRLSIFMVPMRKNLVEHCAIIAVQGGFQANAGLASSAAETNKNAKLIAEKNNALIKQLTANKVLFKVMYEGDKDRYIVHPTVREYIFHSLHHSSTRDLPNLTLSGFTSGFDEVYPGIPEGKEIVTKLFGSIVKSANDCMLLPGAEEVPREAVNLCRDAFSVIRSRMVVNAVPRWSTYEEYLGYLAQLIDLARSTSPRCWDYAVKDAEGTSAIFQHDNAPLHADEVAWMYNEAGLAYYSEGAILDAIAVWEQGYEINKVVDSEPEGGRYVFQSLCNLGAANIQFGRLRAAESYLRRAHHVGQHLGEVDHMARITGYLALVRHLQDNLEEAHKLYEKTTEQLASVENMRALSIFLRHHGGLLIKRGRLDEAAIKIQSSRAIAEAGHYRDLIAYARVSQGHLFRSRKQFSDAIREYRIALEEARTLGIGRLEAEAHSELARVALDLGDAQVARRRAMKALQIANERVLGLRQTHAMVILGKATIQAGDRELGIHYLKHARKLAEKQEYRLRYNEAEAALDASDSGEDPDIEPLHAALKNKQKGAYA